MRIILTNKGVEVVKDLKDLRSASVAKERMKLENNEVQQNRQFVRGELRKLKEISKGKKVIRPIKSELYFEEDEIKPTYRQEIKLQPKKLILPKSLIEQYNNSNSLSNSIVKPDKIVNPKELNHQMSMTGLGPDVHYSTNQIGGSDSFRMKKSFPKIKTTVTLKQIIKPNALNSLFDETEKRDKYFKINNLKVNKNMYREPIIVTSSKVRIKQLLERHIPIDQQDMIRYLNSCSKISENFINKISGAPNDKQRLYNKICQRTLSRIKDEEQMKHRLRETIGRNNIKLKESVIKSIGELDKISKQESVLIEEFDFANRKDLRKSF